MNRHTRHIIATAFRWAEHRRKGGGLALPEDSLGRAILAHILDTGDVSEDTDNGDGSRSLELGIPEEIGLQVAMFHFACATLGSAGCPVVTLSEDLAHQLAETERPDTADGASSALVLDVGSDASILVCGECPGSEAGRVLGVHEDAFEQVLIDGKIPERRLSFGAWPFDAGQTERIVANLNFILTNRPDGVTVTERTPSAKAARKRGEDPRKLPKVLYVIGSTIPLTRCARRACGPPGGSHGG